MMVAQDLCPADVLDPSRDIAFPSSVVEMLRGDLGQPPGGWPEDIQWRVLGEEKAITVRPGSLLEEKDLDVTRECAFAECRKALSDQEFASYLMYPKVFASFCDARRRFGPVCALPTPTYFYGMKPGDEINVTIEEGKTLIVRLTAIGDVEEDGAVRVYFELNGQPRVITMADRRHRQTRIHRRIADPADENQIAAPMPAVVSALAVRQGQMVRAGELMVTLEAMKMETAILAPRDCSIRELLVNAGQSIDAKELLLVLE
jgi:pyruvate carboxylase